MSGLLRTACGHNQAWQQCGKRPVRTSINVSHSLFHGSTVLSVVGETLRQTGLAPACLELELAESVAMRKVDASIVLLTTVQVMGGQISIDDCGTGCSSLSYVHRLPISRVKINQSCIQEILTQTRPPAIVQSIIAWPTASTSSCSPRGRAGGSTNGPAG